MKSYLLVTGLLFALLALVHFVRTAVEWSRLTSDPWFVLEGPGIGVFAGCLCLWAGWLFRATRSH